MCGNKTKSPRFTQYIDRQIAYHLGVVSRSFQNGEIDENWVENCDETHLVYDLDDMTSFVRKGSEIKYMDVVSGSKGMTIMLRLTGGPNAKLMAPFFIFQNYSENYPIRGIPPIEGCPYRTQKRGWMDRNMFLEWLSEPQAIAPAPSGVVHDLFLDNSTGHAETPEVKNALNSINKKLCKLPPNATDKVQALDSFIIREFRRIWKSSWNNERRRSIELQQFSTRSGKVDHPHTHWYMRLSLECSEKINACVDEEGISIARKAIIRTGLYPDVDGN